MIACSLIPILKLFLIPALLILLFLVKKECPVLNQEQAFTPNSLNPSDYNSDVVIVPVHSAEKAGQHRRYTFHLHLASKKSFNATITVEWQISKQFFIDIWSLRRNYQLFVSDDVNYSVAPVEWSILPSLPNLEVGSYDNQATDFSLSAKLFVSAKPSHPSNTTISLVIPDLNIRYQKPILSRDIHLYYKDIQFSFFDLFFYSKTNLIRSGSFLLPSPKLQFNPTLPLKFILLEDQLSPLSFDAPIGIGSPLILYLTTFTLIMCSVGIGVSLAKY